MTSIQEDRDLATRWLIGLIDSDRAQTDDVLGAGMATAESRAQIKSLILGLSGIALEGVALLHEEEPRDVLQRQLIESAALAAAEGSDDA